MGMFINTNVAALNAQRNLSVTGGKMSKALEQLLTATAWAAPQ